jgi:hypothetical protein
MQISVKSLKLNFKNDSECEWCNDDDDDDDDDIHNFLWFIMYYLTLMSISSSHNPQKSETFFFNF